MKPRISVVVALVLLLVGALLAQGHSPPGFSSPGEGLLGGGNSLSNGQIAPGIVSAYPVGSDTIPLSSRMFGNLFSEIPNLEFGFLYNIGPNLGSGRFTLDYLLPIVPDSDSVLFGELHGEFQDFWRRPSVSFSAAPNSPATTSGAEQRTDLSLGGGYRKLLNKGFLLGVNGFYDGSSIFGKWYSSGGVGLEMAGLIAGDSAFDLNFNYYGNLFSRADFVNAFRQNNASFDLEAAYSQSLFNQAYDLRLKLAGYRFYAGKPVYGWRTGADLTTRNGMFTLRYERADDAVNGSYNTIGGFLNVGFSLDELLQGGNPISMPEPVFASPRNLRRLLTQKVKRNWHQPSQIVMANAQRNAGPSGAPGPTAYFVLSLGPSAGFGSATYSQAPSNTTGTMTVTFTYLGALGLWINTTYTVTLVGTPLGGFPVTATIDPGPLTGGEFALFVRENPTGGAETTTMNNAGDVVKVIPPDGNSGPPNVTRPQLSTGGLGHPPNSVAGTITISAPGVQTLTITVIAAN